jgi:ribonuclease E
VAVEPADNAPDQLGDAAPVSRTTRRRRAVKATPAAQPEPSQPESTQVAPPAEAVPATAATEPGAPDRPEQPVAEAAPAEPAAEAPRTRRRAAPATTVLFMPPTEAEAEAEAEAARTSRRRRGRRGDAVAAAPVAEAEPEIEEAVEADVDEDQDDEDDDSAAARRRRRRGRRGRGRGRGGYDDVDDEATEPAAEGGDEAEEPEEAEEAEEAEDEAEAEEGVTRRRRRRRTRKGAGEVESAPDDPANTVVKVREPRAPRERDRDEVQGVSGSTRLEAKRQRRRDGREQRRTRPPILSESEFLARREAVDRVMAVRQKGDRTQIAVLEDGVLVEHYVHRASAATMVGNVYLGRVQNVLPSMEAAFVDIGRGRNAVLYAGEVNWDASGLEGRTRTIEQALKSGDSVLVQVTKDPIGTKGARLTSHIALSGRHLVYVPNGNASGISRKLSDVERKRLRDVLKNLVPDHAGVIVRTAAEGASEDELARDVKRLQAQWEEIHARSGESGAPKLLYEEPDLLIRVVRDLFNEDFGELVIQGSEAYDMVEAYLQHVSPDLVSRVRRHSGTGDVFQEVRVDEQILKGLDRRVFLPSGGHLVIDRTEAMTVIDVNTGKYTGAGGNLEETVTRNNLEAAEEIVRQLRLRDLGGIIVIDFIDMVLESNRDLVLRRLTECLGRDRTKHQVTEITSLGLVQMTRKRVGQGLLEAFSENCEVCKGRGLIIHPEPVPDKRGSAGPGPAKVAAASVPTGKADEPSENGRGSRRRRKATVAAEPAPADDAAAAGLATGVDDGAGDEASGDDPLDAHEAAFAGMDPAPAVGFDDDGIEGDNAEAEPVGARRRGRRRR